MSPDDDRHGTVTAKKIDDQDSRESESLEQLQGHKDTKGSQVEVPVEEPREKELEELRKALEEEKSKAEQYLTSLKYLKAEFENYQKRTMKEKEEIAKVGSERLARKLLGIVDDFERTINASKGAAEPKKLLSGVEMILNELHKILKSEGIVKIDAVGKRFDPEIHEAAAVVTTDKQPADTVVEEQRAGYMFNGRVLRPSMVVVVKAPEKCSESQESTVAGKERNEPRSDKDRGINKEA